MAKKDRINIDNTGVDKLEFFLQHNIKKIVFIITGLLVIFIVSYLVYTAKNVSTNKKIDRLGAAEIMMFDNASIDSFVKLSTELPSLKDYIALRGAGMYYLLDNKTAAVQELKNVGGKYAELGAGMLYDMGESIVPSNYLNGSMREVWHYRNVLSSDNNSVETNINNFKLLYPESPLLKMVENWNVK